VDGEDFFGTPAEDAVFVSVITIKDRKITHWRDYLDPVAVFDAIGWPTQRGR
jgi:ketosteroid isomerase-like protein